MKKDKSVVTESPSGSGITISSSSNRLFFREEEESERKQTIYDFPLPIVTRMVLPNTTSSSSQSDLETNLFKLMKWRGYGQKYINRYRMMTRFHHQRVPLVILVCGTTCVGKSTIATQLAQRLNLPNVLQTDMVYELLRTSTDAPLASSPLLARDFSSSDELITEFCRECRIVRKGLADDLKKAMKDGKPIIIEEMHVDPINSMKDQPQTLLGDVVQVDTWVAPSGKNDMQLPEGEGEKLDLEVYNFTGAGGVAQSMYNTDESITAFAEASMNTAYEKKWRRRVLGLLSREHYLNTEEFIDAVANELKGRLVGKSSL
ncbi:hypothetical protein LXL04_028605 [Taraxacum kok-saghyz]